MSRLRGRMMMESCFSLERIAMRVSLRADFRSLSSFLSSWASIFQCPFSVCLWCFAWVSFLLGCGGRPVCLYSLIFRTDSSVTVHTHWSCNRLISVNFMIFETTSNSPSNACDFPQAFDPQLKPLSWSHSSSFLTHWWTPWTYFLRKTLFDRSSGPLVTVADQVERYKTQRHSSWVSFGSFCFDSSAIVDRDSLIGAPKIRNLSIHSIRILAGNQNRPSHFGRGSSGLNMFVGDVWRRILCCWFGCLGPLRVGMTRLGMSRWWTTNRHTIELSLTAPFLYQMPYSLFRYAQEDVSSLCYLSLPPPSY